MKKLFEKKCFFQLYLDISFPCNVLHKKNPENNRLKRFRVVSWTVYALSTHLITFKQIFLLHAFSSFRRRANFQTRLKQKGHSSVATPSPRINVLPETARDNLLLRIRLCRSHVGTVNVLM